MSLGVVVQSLKLVKHVNQQLPPFLLFRDHQSIALQSCIHLHSFCSIVSATHAHYQWFSKSYGLCLSHDALQLLTLLLRTTSMDRSVLEVVASACTELNNVNVIVSIMTKWHWSFAAPVPSIWLSWCLPEAGAAWRGFICNRVQRSLQVTLLHQAVVNTHLN